jgi:hypothetical protein
MRRMPTVGALRTVVLVLSLSLPFAPAGCEDDGGGTSTDARPDAAGDARADGAGVDGGTDAAADAAGDGRDAGGGSDVRADAAADSPVDTGPDAGPDAPADAAGDGADAGGGGGQQGDPCGDPGQAACMPGLRCCYPCGIEGCHNRCITPCTQGPACAGGCPLFP